MKKLYSLILLFSFLAGAIQPVVPLLEYHVFKQSIIELLCEDRNIPESDCDGSCYLSNQIQESQEKQSDMAVSIGDFYPGTVLCERLPDLNLYPENNNDFPGYACHCVYHFLTTDIPPPKVSWV